MLSQVRPIIESLFQLISLLTTAEKELNTVSNGTSQNDEDHMEHTILGFQNLNCCPSSLQLLHLLVVLVKTPDTAKDMRYHSNDSIPVESIHVIFVVERLGFLVVV